MEQYGTIVIVENVFHSKYIITIQATSPAVLSA